MNIYSELLRIFLVWATGLFLIEVRLFFVRGGLFSSRIFSIRVGFFCVRVGLFFDRSRTFLARGGLFSIGVGLFWLEEDFF